MTDEQCYGIASECLVRGVVTEDAQSYDFWYAVSVALLKQIKRAPVEDDSDGWLDWRCPRCGKVVGVIMNFKLQSCECGQRILWDEVDS